MPSAYATSSNLLRPHLRLGIAILVAATTLWITAATSTPALALTTGYLATPTEQLAVPGNIATGEITPEGDIYTGWAEYELRFGPALESWNQPTRTLPDPAEPLFDSTLIRSGVSYTQRVFTASVDGTPVTYLSLIATNETGGPKEARAVMQIAYSKGRQEKSMMTGGYVGAFRFPRPQAASSLGAFTQIGEAFNPGWTYSIVSSGHEVLRNGLLLLKGPPSTPFDIHAPQGSGWDSPHAAQIYTKRLDARGSVTWTWQIPLDPPALAASAPGSITAAGATLSATPLAAALSSFKQIWASQEDGMTRIIVPESKVNATYQASVAEILAARYQTPQGWLQAGNKLQYHAYWIRDAATMSHALDLVGLHTPSAQNIAFMGNFQQADGEFLTQDGQLDGTGQALWVMAEHARLTGEALTPQETAEMDKAVSWISSVASSDPLGLIPTGNPGDDELVTGHITGDDLWTAAGLKAAINYATACGANTLATRWQGVASTFDASLHTALAAAVARAGYIPPSLDASGGQDWGNFVPSFPEPVLAPTGPWVQATIAEEQKRSAEGLPTYDNGASLHDYLGFAVFETELNAGEEGSISSDTAAALSGFYAETTHTTSTDAGWEWDIAPYGNRSSAQNLTPHDTFSADYVTFLRNLLVTDTPTGGVTLGAGVSPAWVGPGKTVSVQGAPAGPAGASGTISYTLTGTKSGAILHWSSTIPANVPLTWSLPFWAQHPKIGGTALVGPIVSLHTASGMVQVSWSGHAPHISFDAARDALNRAYESRHKLAPFVRATH